MEKTVSVRAYLETANGAFIPTTSIEAAFSRLGQSIVRTLDGREHVLASGEIREARRYLSLPAECRRALDSGAPTAG